ncbi:MAG TPA: glycosyltransferase family 2 protein [Candidatus Scybalocola faecipullorum]|nr:glycosyltransferase family 2 protein [Candidatus Scybalocola faecipullorum]
MLISVIIPCFNEAEVIEKTWEKLSEVLTADEQHRDEPYMHELIFVDDGSSDATMAKIKALACQDHHLKYISFSRNFGKEAAMLAGLSYAAGDCVIIMDADLQHPPELIPEMIDGWKDGYDQVIARRNRVGDNKRKTMAAHLYYKIINHIVDVKMTDGIGDFRLLDKKAVAALVSMQEYNRFSKGLFSWIGFKQKIINYENRQRAGGETKWSFKRLLSYGIDGLISFNNKPLRACCVLGFFLVFISLIYILITFIQIIAHGVDVPGYFTLISAVLIIGGVQLISIGVLGEYIGRIYYEVKRRPHFLIQETNIATENKTVSDVRKM